MSQISGLVGLLALGSLLVSLLAGVDWLRGNGPDFSWLMCLVIGFALAVLSGRLYKLSGGKRYYKWDVRSPSDD